MAAPPPRSPDPAAAIPSGVLPTETTWLTLAGVRVDAVQRRVELIAHPYAVAGRGDRTGPVPHADGGGHPAGRRVEPGHREVQ